MKTVVLAGVLLIGGGIGVAQDNASDQVKLSALKMDRDGEVMKVRGHAQVITDSVVIHADEVDYDTRTSQLDARGHVHIDLKAAKSNAPEDTPLMK